MLHRIALLLIYSTGLAGGPSAFARVFSQKDSGLAAYVRGSGGTSNLGKDAFDGANGAGSKVSASSTLQYGGEAGAMFGVGANFHIRLGLEVIQHAGVTKVGTSASGTERFNLDSSVFVFNPNLTFEYFFSPAGGMRFFAALGAGYADVTVDNRYVRSASSDLAEGDFNEKLAGKGLSGHFLVGMETMFVDNVALAVDVGYRYLPVASMTYKGDFTGFNGAVSKGETALDADGKKRSMDLGGVVAGLSFRFYLNFL